MFKIIFLLFLFTYVNCESDLNEHVTTISPIYSANQIDDDINSNIENKSSDKQSILRPVEKEPVMIANEVSFAANDEIQNNNEFNNVELTRVREVQQNHLNLSPISENTETVTMFAEVTTVEPTVSRVKRAPRYTVRELMYPYGIMHEVGHVRDHAVERVAKTVARSRIPGLSRRAARVAATSKAKTEFHHKNHHIPNHLAYLPVVGPLLDENRPRNTLRSRILRPTRLFRLGRIRRGGLRRRILF